MDKIAKGLIEYLRSQGVDMDSPYDLENFIADHCSHSQLFECGAFPDEVA
jgi:hypothetical protein